MKTFIVLLTLLVSVSQAMASEGDSSAALNRASEHLANRSQYLSYHVLVASILVKRVSLEEPISRAFMEYDSCLSEEIASYPNPTLTSNPDSGVMDCVREFKKRLTKEECQVASEAITVSMERAFEVKDELCAKAGL